MPPGRSSTTCHAVVILRFAEEDRTTKRKKERARLDTPHRSKRTFDSCTTDMEFKCPLADTRGSVAACRSVDSVQPGEGWGQDQSRKFLPPEFGSCGGAAAGFDIRPDQIEAIIVVDDMAAYGFAGCGQRVLAAGCQTLDS